MLIIIFACPAVCDGPGGETVSPVGTMLHNGEHWYGAQGGGDGDFGGQALGFHSQNHAVNVSTMNNFKMKKL